MEPVPAHSHLSRREWIRLSLFGSLATLACRRTGTLHPSVASTQPLPAGFGALVPDPNGYFDLPKGFSVALLQKAGDPMSCGNQVPGQPDGMTCHIDSDGNYVLLRNHELSDQSWFEKYGEGMTMDFYREGHPPKEAYNPEMFGSVTRLVLNPDALAEAIRTGSDARSAISNSNLVLTGTEFNCSGGKVPEGWISCEETDRANHGYAFLTRVDDTRLVDPKTRRIHSWGRLKREGITQIPDTGWVYMTEDHDEGCFYRFLPDDPLSPMGSGRLQAMVIDGIPDTDPETPLAQGTSWKTRWVDVPDPQATEQACRDQARQVGATRFNRCEGSLWDGESVWFIASTAGPSKAGQIYRHDIEQERITLSVQVEDRRVLSMPDNLTLSPWGDLVMAEDNYNNEGGATHQHLRGLNAKGQIYDLGRNPMNRPDHPGGEISGPCFSPDGRFLFLNLQRPRHLTLAITGPWAVLNR